MPEKGSAVPQQRSVWEKPTLTKLDMGADTKSASGNAPPAGEPPPPAPPGTKLGFAFEWSLPLSARTDT